MIRTTPPPLMLIAALVFLAAGCRGDGRDDGTDLSDEPAAQRVRGSAGTDADTMDEAMRSSKLQSLPPAVQLAAGKKYPGATITGTRAQPSPAGVLYRVTYIRDGKPVSTLFNDQGQEVAAPGAAVTRPGNNNAAATTVPAP